MKRFIPFLILLTVLPGTARAQTFTDSFSEMGDTLTALAGARFGVKSEVRVWKAMKRGDLVDLYFTNKLADYPWRPADSKWLKDRIREFWPSEAKGYGMGMVLSKNQDFDELMTPGPGDGSGRPQDYKYAFRDHKTPAPFVERLGVQKPPKGLAGRNIALWQSHGLYFDNGSGFWSWQRAPVFRTYEDLYTQSYVLPYLIPMLENAGAYVMTPRERDIQTNEVVCDNDPSYSRSSGYGLSDWASAFDSPLPSRRHGKYSEKGGWSSAGAGFADAMQIYTAGDNPFAMGTARKADCVKGKGNARAVWVPDIPERGEYAVYVSYKTLPGSTRSAHYTVSHLGGETEFCVDQTKGGGTWIYLGTFEFGEGASGSVVLDNGTPAGHEGGKVVTADAVRFGGGIGKVARGRGSSANSDWTSSGMPSYTEGALYWMQWAGAPEKVWNKWDGDYTRDYAGRGAWVKWMKDDLGIPFDLSLAFHSDAGVTPNDSIVGTLAIYTLTEEGSRKFKNGKDRLACRFLGDCIQTQVVQDLKARYDTLWQRRQLWDRSYSECRTTDVPGIILELLSHQNFADQRYGFDPQFKFDVSRAVYKGILKFLSTYYGVQYVVQPLPVRDFSVSFPSDGKVLLSWTGHKDPLEPTSAPAGYTVYTRIDGGGWDDGRTVKATSVELPAPEGHIYSYKVVAFNDGGCSFPSETLSVGNPVAARQKILIVNNFTRISGPTFFDYPGYAGFDDALDGGVPDGWDISFIGEDYEHRRSSEYVSNNAPGFGGSDYYAAGRKYAGNSFDYPYVHGKALFELGYAFASTSESAFELAPVLEDVFAVDVICGKQVSTTMGTGVHGTRFRVFPEGLRDALRGYAAKGSNLLVSGSDIATDGWDTVYPVKDVDFPAYQAAVQSFATGTLGYRWTSGRASRDGIVLPNGGRFTDGSFEIHNTRNMQSYCVENPDAIRPADKDGRSVLKYRSSNLSAAVFYNGGDYRTACFGFPLEALKDASAIKTILKTSLDYFSE